MRPAVAGESKRKEFPGAAASCRNDITNYETNPSQLRAKLPIAIQCFAFRSASASDLDRHSAARMVRSGLATGLSNAAIADAQAALVE